MRHQCGYTTHASLAQSIHREPYRHQGTQWFFRDHSQGARYRACNSSSGRLYLHPAIAGFCADHGNRFLGCVFPLNNDLTHEKPSFLADRRMKKRTVVKPFVNRLLHILLHEHCYETSPLSLCSVCYLMLLAEDKRYT